MKKKFFAVFFALLVLCTAVVPVFADEAEARTAAAALKTRWPQVYVAQPDKGGARVTAPKWML